MGVEVVLVPPVVTVVQHHRDVHASVLCVDHGFNEVDLVQQVHVNVERIRGAVNPRQQINEAVFWPDERGDGSRIRDTGVKTEGAASQATPLLVPIVHGVGVRRVAAAASTKIDQVVKIGDGFCQRNAVPARHIHGSVAVHQGVRLIPSAVKELQGSTRIGEVEGAVKDAASRSITVPSS